ncbi:uncharacterized protein LOC128867221 [Anastrepha ludens]|uniref:uncharacterized protein LOC128867221 n=1 Tax=Anastrepha ludens TaxID=28586 RepID=UPI0023B11AAF|nr:uncharacterized protein LOC128867221 [Anastrepha ludens]
MEDSEHISVLMEGSEIPPAATIGEADKPSNDTATGIGSTFTAGSAPYCHASTPTTHPSTFTVPGVNNASMITSVHGTQPHYMVYSTSAPLFQTAAVNAFTSTRGPGIANGDIPNLTSAFMPCSALTYPTFGNTFRPFCSQTNMHSRVAPPPNTSVFMQPNIMSSCNQTRDPSYNVFSQYSTSDVNLTPTQISSRQVITKDLPTFSGRPEDWPLFITNYEQSTERCGFTDQENLIRLQKCLKGPALEAVRGRLMMPATVGLAINTMRMLYGRPDIIHQTMQMKLRQEPAVRADKLETLIVFSLAVQNYRATIQAVGLADYLNDPVLLNDLVAKLPSDQRLNWGGYRMSLSRVDIAVFDDWLFGLATCASQVTRCEPPTTTSAFENIEVKKGRNSHKARILVHEVMAKNVEVNAKVTMCPKCSANHKLSDCAEFTALSRSDRWLFVREKKLCLRCFNSHYVRRCNLKNRCGVDGCQMAHNALLHTPVPVKSNVGHEQTALYHERHSGSPKEKKNSLFRYVAVTVRNASKSVDTYALIDEGASCTLIENELADYLELDGPSEALCLRWTNEITQSENNSKFVSFEIASTQLGSPNYLLRGVRTIARLGLPVQTLDRDTMEKHAHLKGLPILPYNGARARILIGVDNAKVCVPIEVKKSSTSNLIAARCRLGWTVYGRDTSEHAVMPRVLHICSCDPTGRDRMDEQMKAYFAIDAIGVYAPAKPLRSKDDERALQLMEKFTKFLPTEKRWETRLLWKQDVVDLPDSLPMARRRLMCLEAKMKRDPELHRFIVDKIDDYKKKGYIRKLESLETSIGGRSWYLPIFTVLNVNKNKTRLVWDAAAKAGNTALNNMLLKGPDQLNSMMGILLRFRERPFAICGDLREMFHQIKVAKEDQVAQKFLWRDGESNRQPDVYAMCVLTFGASCSPSLANYVENQNAQRFSENYPEAVQAIISNTFVDDWLQSADNEEELSRLATVVRWIHNEGGFEMRNWVSNSKKTLTALSANSTLLSRCFEEPEATIEKVLGMWWLPASDELTFVEKFPKEVFDEHTFPSKRQVLRTIMKIFDPLGLLGYVIIQAKIILQDIWRSGVNWDEPIREDDRSNWWNWLKRISSINNVKIPRCYLLSSCSQSNQLHIFVDASINAYAAVPYLRAEVGNAVNCSLLASKTRVTPLKPISIPRLELMAAVLGLRLAVFIGKQLSVQMQESSINLLRYVSALEGSSAKEWRWLPSSENIADEGTKWSDVRHFDDNARWFRGPKFLAQPESSWPVGELVGTTAELHHISTSTPLSPTLSVISPDVRRFSTWERLLSTQQIVLRFLRRILKFTPRSLLKLFELRDIEAAEQILIAVSQENAFSEEVKSLQHGQNIQRQSAIYKWSPYLDEVGILRVKGRIDFLEGVAVDVKRPVILPKNHTVTRLIIDFYHRKFHHHHNEIIVNEMRQRYCVGALRSMVKECAKRCQMCRNRKAKPQPPQMGSLPVERLSPFTRPFTFTGVDYFGPIDVAVGRRREKRWGVLFTYLTSRAVHIEIAASLSTETFLLMLKLFVCRRGVPKRIVSDNGTNFRGASRALISEIERVSSDDLERRHPQIEWSFIPPSAPHMGGAWERMIQSTKSILMDITHEEVLRATLADIENILNSRPLTYVPLETADDDALTPNHFLLGNSSGIRESGCDDDSGPALRRCFRISNQLANQFWKRWMQEYLPCLTRRSKWFHPPIRPIEINDVVVIVDNNAKRNSWPKGIVIDLHRGKDGEARSAVVKLANGLCTRPVIKLAKLDVTSHN